MPAVLQPLKLRPRPGERQVDFYLRASKALKRKYSRCDQRTSAVHDLWIKGGGEAALQQIAREKFPADQFVCVRSRPIFAEHITTDSKGQPERYDRQALQAVCDRCNERILDTGDFPPLTDGHTPTAEMAENGAKHPDVLGYAGPFRVGLLGNRSPRWAIFADEWQHKDEYSRLRKLQRRSPEVWREPRMEDRFMDPIACLGSETPRLDLGLTSRFCRTASGAVVEKYTAACLPAGGNTFAPAPVGKAKKPPVSRYAAGEAPMDQPPVQPTGDMPNVDPNLVKAIIGALLETAPMKWVIQQQQAQEQAANASPGEGEPDGDEMPLPDDGAGDELPSPDVADGDDDGMGDADADVLPDESMDNDQPGDNAPEVFDEDAPADDMPADDVPSEDGGDESDMDEEEAQHYAALPPAYRPHYLQGRRAWRKRYAADMGGGAAMYSRGRNGNGNVNVASLMHDIAELQKQVRTLSKVNRYSARRAELERLAADFAFDLEPELIETRDYEPAQWDQHLQRIKTRYSRRTNATGVPQLPTPPLDKPPVPKARGDRSVVDKFSIKAREIVERAAMTRGAKIPTWDEALDKARQELGGK